MTLEEKQAEFTRLASIGMLALKGGFHFLPLEEASDYFRASFCDDFKDFLNTEYSLGRLSGEKCEED